jgi:hypothetical protein
LTPDHAGRGPLHLIEGSCTDVAGGSQGACRRRFGRGGGVDAHFLGALNRAFNERFRSGGDIAADFGHGLNHARRRRAEYLRRLFDHLFRSSKHAHHRASGRRSEIAANVRCPLDQSACDTGCRCRSCLADVSDALDGTGRRRCDRIDSLHTHAARSLNHAFHRLTRGVAGITSNLGCGLDEILNG